VEKEETSTIWKPKQRRIKVSQMQMRSTKDVRRKEGRKGMEGRKEGRKGME